MDKSRILAEIKRIASANGGKAPGMAVFERETGIAYCDWFPHLWLRWGDAVVEAGYAANQFQAAYSKDFLVEKYIALIRELGRIPVKGELLLKSKADKTFPNQKVFYSDGKEGLLKRVIQCHGHAGNEDIASLCIAAAQTAGARSNRKENESRDRLCLFNAVGTSLQNRPHNLRRSPRTSARDQDSRTTDNNSPHRN